MVIRFDFLQKVQFSNRKSIWTGQPPWNFKIVTVRMRITIYGPVCIHTKKLSCLKSGVGFDMNNILYEFNNLHHF